MKVSGARLLSKPKDFGSGFDPWAVGIDTSWLRMAATLTMCEDLEFHSPALVRDHLDIECAFEPCAPTFKSPIGRKLAEEKKVRKKKPAPAPIACDIKPDPEVASRFFESSPKHRRSTRRSTRGDAGARQKSPPRTEVLPPPTFASTRKWAEVATFDRTRAKAEPRSLTPPFPKEHRAPPPSPTPESSEEVPKLISPIRKVAPPDADDWGHFLYLDEAHSSVPPLRR